MSRKPGSVPLKKLLPSIVENVNRYRAEIATQKRLIIFSLSCLLFAIIARVFEPWPLKFVFDLILVPNHHDATSARLLSLLHSIGIRNSGSILLSIIAGMIVLITLRASGIYLSNVAMAVASTNIVTQIRAKLFSHLQKLSLAYHHQSKSGDLITRFTYDANRLREVTSTAFVPLLANIFTVLGMLIIMVIYNLELTLIVMTVIPIFILSSIHLSTKIKNVVKLQREKDGAVAATAAESIGSIKIIQALSLSSVTEKIFSKHNSKSLKEGAKAQRLGASLERNVEVLLAITTAIILWRGVNLVQHGVISTGTLLVFISYLGLTFRPMRQSAKYLTQISKALASGDRVGDILDTLPDIIEREDAIEAKNIKGTLHFDNVLFSYPNRNPALQRFNLTVNAGQRIAIVGPSGAGKSTVLSLLLRLYDPQIGRISLDGVDLPLYKLESLRKQMSIVLQDSALFAVSIRDNIGYGNLKASDADIEAAARMANAHDFILSLPNGYDTVIGERGADLSGGQRQRITLARAVVRNAPIMILDEPTTGLDKSNERDVLAALEQCTQGLTTIMVTHHLNAAESFDVIYYVDEGRIVESGPHDELYKKKGKYWRLYTKQLQDEEYVQPTKITKNSIVV